LKNHKDAKDTKNFWSRKAGDFPKVQILTVIASDSEAIYFRNFDMQEIASPVFFRYE